MVCRFVVGGGRAATDTRQPAALPRQFRRRLTSLSRQKIYRNLEMDVNPEQASPPAADPTIQDCQVKSASQFPHNSSGVPAEIPFAWLYERDKRVDRILDGEIDQQRGISAILAKKFEEYIAAPERDFQDVKEVGPEFGQFLQLARQIERNMRLQQDIERTRRANLGLGATPRREK
jgi:hypothetical protein